MAPTKKDKLISSLQALKMPALQKLIQNLSTKDYFTTYLARRKLPANTNFDTLLTYFLFEELFLKYPEAIDHPNGGPLKRFLKDDMRLVDIDDLLLKKNNNPNSRKSKL